MISLFSRKPKNYLGVDIGTASIKVVQLGTKKKDRIWRLMVF